MTDDRLLTPSELSNLRNQAIELEGAVQDILQLYYKALRPIYKENPTEEDACLLLKYFDDMAAILNKSVYIRASFYNCLLDLSNKVFERVK